MRYGCTAELTIGALLCLIVLSSIIGCEPPNPPMEQPVKVGIVEKVDITGNYGKYVIVVTDGNRELLWWRTVSDIDELWAKAKLGEQLEYHE